MKTELSIVSIFVLFLLILPGQSIATVKPSLSYLVRKSDIVLVGTVIEAKKVTESETYIVNIGTDEVLKGADEFSSGEFEISYTRYGKGNINFSNLAKSKVKQVFFLEKEASNKEGRLQLASAWFGVEKATKELVAEIKEIRNVNDALISIEESGGCFRLRTCGVYTLYKDGHFTLSRNKGRSSKTYLDLFNIRIEKQSKLSLDETKTLSELLRKEDFNKLKLTLKKGHCSGCVDGLDYRFFIPQNQKTNILSSLEHKIDDKTKPVLEQIHSTYKLMKNKLRLDPIFR